MALGKLNYSKNWNNPEDFPTYEGRESQVRADIQLLYDEIQEAFNQLIDDLHASEIPFTEVDGKVEADNVQDAILDVQEQIASVSQGSIPNRSVGGTKLELGAVGEDEIADGSVTEPKIGPRAVTDGKIALKAIKEEHIDDEVLTTRMFQTNVPTYKADLDDGIVSRVQKRWRKTVISTESYTLTPSDAESILWCDSLPAEAEGITIMVPEDGLVFSGAMVAVVNNIYPSAPVTIASGSGIGFVTRFGSSSEDYVAKTGETVLLMKVASNAWALIGSSVSSKMLADGCVDTDKIEGLAVTNPKLADECIALRNIPDKLITGEKVDFDSGIQRSLIRKSMLIWPARWDTVNKCCRTQLDICNPEDFVSARVNTLSMSTYGYPDVTWNEVGKWGIYLTGVVWGFPNTEVILSCKEVPTKTVSVEFLVLRVSDATPGVQPGPEPTPTPIEE